MLQTAADVQLGSTEFDNVMINKYKGINNKVEYSYL